MINIPSIIIIIVFCFFNNIVSKSFLFYNNIVSNFLTLLCQVPWGVEGRAYLTLPPGLRISPSKIKRAGFGVFSDTFIPKYTWLGDFEGEIIPKEFAGHLSTYTWQVSIEPVPWAD